MSGEISRNGLKNILNSTDKKQEKYMANELFERALKTFEDRKEGLLGEPGRDFAQHTAIDIIGEILGLENLGLMKIPYDQGRKLFEAIHETHEANEREAIASGTRWGINLVWSDHQNPNNPHIQEGKEYTKSELCQRIEKSSFRLNKENELLSLRVLNSDAPKQFDDGIGRVADAANSVLKEFKNKTPGERQKAMKVFTDSAQKAIEQQRKNECTKSTSRETSKIREIDVQSNQREIFKMDRPFQ